MTAETVRCDTCPRGCVLHEGENGACGVRGCRNGAVIPLNYGRLTSVAIDPVEKKPLARFRPGSRILSVGSYGCNMACPFCQNHEISKAETAPDGSAWEDAAESCTPEQLCDLAVDYARRAGNIGVAYTYNEPLTGWEFVRDTSRLVREAGLVNVIVTNGCVNAHVWRELLPVTDAVNIDLKCYTEEGYRRLGGDLDTVKESIRLCARHCHTEITSLIVPGLNDDEAQMEEEAAFLASVSPEIVLHVTRYFPRYRMTAGEPTPIAVIERLTEAAGRYLKEVLPGNV